MGHRTGRLIAVAVVAMAVATSCSGVDGSGPSGSGGGEADGAAGQERTIASADEVIKVVDKGFVAYKVERYGIRSDYLSYGFVIENVSDEVAISVRASVEFSDKAGNPVEGHGGEDFTVVLPGQQVGTGSNGLLEGEIPAEMAVKITFIAALDTMDGERYRQPPGPYAELQTSDPVVSPKKGTNGKRASTTVTVTNTHDVPLKPRASAVVRDSEGRIVGGARTNAAKEEVQPGASTPRAFDMDVQLPRIAEGTAEYYADPMWGWMVTADPVWQDEL